MSRILPALNQPKKVEVIRKARKLLDDVTREMQKKRKQEIMAALPKCGAKRRLGRPPCSAIAMANGRCRIHGGKAKGSKGTKSNMGTGIYDSFISPQDQQFIQEIELGSVHDELKIARLQLARLLRAQRIFDEALEQGITPTRGMFTDTVTTYTKTGRNDNGDFEEDYSGKVIKRPDFEALIDRALARIGNLEKLDKELVEGIKLNLQVSGTDNAPAVDIRVYEAMSDVELARVYRETAEKAGVP